MEHDCRFWSICLTSEVGAWKFLHPVDGGRPRTYHPTGGPLSRYQRRTLNSEDGSYAYKSKRKSLTKYD